MERIPAAPAQIHAHAVPSGQSERPLRLVGLDVLRFVAVTLVFLRHLDVPTPLPQPWGPWVQFLRNGGWVGVDLFFVLSGFLVSGLLFTEWQKRQSVSVGRFLIRRGLKIYPAFWGLMIYTGIYYTVTPGPSNLRPRDIAGELLFLQNYIGSVWPHTWSLAVEEHFYLLLAACIGWAVRKKKAVCDNPFTFIPQLCFWTAVVCLAARLALWILAPNYGGRMVMRGTHHRVDSLMFGVWLSYLWHFRLTAERKFALAKLRYPLLAAGIIMLAPAFFYPFEENRWIFVYGFTLFYLAGGCLLLSAIHIFSDASSRPSRFLAYLGSHSYSVYLWHLIPMHYTYIWLGAERSGTLYLLYTLISFPAMWILGIVAAKLIEFPVLKLRNRLFPPRAPAM